MNEKKKIKVVIGINDFLVGGAQRMLVDLLHRMDRNVFEPVLVTLFYWPDKKNFYDLVPADVPVHRIAFKGIWDIRSWMQLLHVLRAIDPDIVLTNLFFSNTVFRMLKPLLGYTVIAVEHNTYTHKTSLHQRVDRVLAHLTARIVAVSKTVADFTARQERIPREKFIVIPNGIDIEKLRSAADPAGVREELGIAPGSRIILNVARLTTQKNPELLIWGFAVFSKKHPGYILVIVGGGGKWEAVLRAQAERLGIADKVILAGIRTDVPRLYAVADFFVSTSTIEGFGIAHAEALACGVPVVTTKTAGPDEMIRDGENGFFITASTPEAVAEGIGKMASADRAKMSGNAAASAHAYSIERMVNAYEDLFRAVYSVHI